MGKSPPRNNAGSFELLEAGLLAFILFASVCFGAVHRWAFMSASAWIFMLLVFYPGAVFCLRDLPRIFVFPMTAVFSWIVIQFFWVSPCPQATLSKGILWVTGTLVFLLTQVLSRNQLIRMMVVLGIAGAIQTIYGMFEVVSGREMVLWQAKGVHAGYVTGTFMNRNHFAGFMELVTGIQLGLSLRFFHKKQYVLGGLGILMLAVTLAGIVQSGSRLGLLGLSISIFIYTLMLMQKSLRSRMFFILFLILSALIALYSGWEIVRARFGELEDQWMTLEGRLTAWQSAAGLIRDRWATGIGLGNFKWIFPAYQSPELIQGWHYLHQDYLELAAELGLPAFVLFLASLIFLGVHCLQKADRSDLSSFALVWGAMIGLTALSIHGFFDFNFAIPSNAWVFFFIFGAIFRLNRFERKVVFSKDEERA